MRPRPNILAARSTPPASAHTSAFATGAALPLIASNEPPIDPPPDFRRAAPIRASEGCERVRCSLFRFLLLTQSLLFVFEER
jgi:hypothetical protein